MDDDYLDDPEAVEGVNEIFEVIKQHHSIGWLRQNRILIVTQSSVLNCKPSSSRQPDGEVTKSILFSSITSVAVAGADKFCLDVEGDHTYYYSSPNALYIAYIIQTRVLAARTIKHLVSGTDVDDEECAILMKSFCRGELQLPHAVGGNGVIRPRSATTNSELPTTCTNIQTRSRSLTAGPARTERIPGFVLSNEIKKMFRDGHYDSARSKARSVAESFLKEITAAQNSPTLINLTRLRDEQMELRDILSSSILQRGDRFLSSIRAEIDDDDDFLNRLSYEIIQEEILGGCSLCLPLWELHLRSVEVSNLQRTFDENVGILSTKPPEFFGVPAELKSVPFHLVQKQMQSLAGAHTPTRLLDALVTISKTIVLTVAATFRVTEERKRKGSQFSSCSCKSLSADDVLPLYIFLMVVSKATHIVFVREWILTLWDADESSERAYHLTVFSSAVEYILRSAESGQVSGK